MPADEPATDTNYLETNLLNPAEVRLFRTSDEDSRVRLEWRGECSFLEVRLARVLPLSAPENYIALRDGADKEIGILYTLDGLDADSRRIIESELTRRYFLPKIVSVTNVKDEFGVVIWDVETDYGPRRYTVRNARDNTVALSMNRALVTDVDGNRFEFPDVESLPMKAQEVLLKSM